MTAPHYRQRLLHYCLEHEECGKALKRLSRLEKDAWETSFHLKSLYAIGNSVWQGFMFRSGAKYGAGILETVSRSGGRYTTEIRIHPDKWDAVTDFLRELYLGAGK